MQRQSERSTRPVPSNCLVTALNFKGVKRHCAGRQPQSAAKWCTPTHKTHSAAYVMSVTWPWADQLFQPLVLHFHCDFNSEKLTGLSLHCVRDAARCCRLAVLKPSTYIAKVFVELGYGTISLDDWCPRFQFRRKKTCITKMP